MRRKLPDTRALTDALHHAPECLVARLRLRVFLPAHAIELRDPLLDLDREHVVVEFGLQRAEACA